VIEYRRVRVGYTNRIVEVKEQNSTGAEERRLYKWVLKNKKMVLSEPVDVFSILAGKNEFGSVFTVDKDNISRCRPENVVTAWELERDYGICRMKTARKVREGKINAFMLGMKDIYHMKWYVECDGNLEAYISLNREID